MSTNELIEDQLKWFTNLQWCEYLSENELHLSDFTLGQLNRLLSKARKSKRATKAFWESVSPPQDAQKSNHWIEADFIEQAVLAEIQSRQALTTAPAMPPAQEEPEFFHGTTAMEKAFEAARLAGLTHADDTWCYTGNKTDGVTIFWRAAITARLAKADAAVSKVAPFLKDRFRLHSLGKGAIDKKRKIESYDRDLQNIYNKLVHLMGK